VHLFFCCSSLKSLQQRSAYNHTLSSPTALQTSLKTSGLCSLRPRQIIMGVMQPAWLAASTIRRAQMVSNGSSRLPIKMLVEKVGVEELKAVSCVCGRVCVCVCVCALGVCTCLYVYMCCVSV